MIGLGGSFLLVAKNPYFLPQPNSSNTQMEIVYKRPLQVTATNQNHKPMDHTNYNMVRPAHYNSKVNATNLPNAKSPLT